MGTDRSYRAAVAHTVRRRPDASAEEIAAVVGCSSATARKHLAVIRQRPKRVRRTRDRLTSDMYLAADPLSQGRCALAADPDVSPRLLSRLARDPDISVRVAAAANRSTPPRALTRLARDRSPSVLVSLAANSSCPAAAFETLLSSGDEPQHTVATNAACPPAVLVQLAQRVVRRESDAVRPSSPRQAHAQRLALQHETAVLIAIAGNPASPATAVEIAAADRDPRVRAAVARRPDLPDRLRRQLSADPHPSVQTAVSTGEDG